MATTQQTQYFHQHKKHICGIQSFKGWTLNEDRFLDSLNDWDQYCEYGDIFLKAPHFAGFWEKAELARVDKFVRTEDWTKLGLKVENDHELVSREYFKLKLPLVRSYWFNSEWLGGFVSIMVGNHQMTENYLDIRRRQNFYLLTGLTFQYAEHFDINGLCHVSFESIRAEDLIEHSLIYNNLKWIASITQDPELISHVVLQELLQ